MELRLLGVRMSSLVSEEGEGPGRGGGISDFLRPSTSAEARRSSSPPPLEAGVGVGVGAGEEAGERCPVCGSAYPSEATDEESRTRHVEECLSRATVAELEQASAPAPVAQSSLSVHQSSSYHAWPPCRSGGRRLSRLRQTDGKVLRRKPNFGRLPSPTFSNRQTSDVHDDKVVL